jgi:predicted phosphoribosyltransferase
MGESGVVGLRGYADRAEAGRELAAPVIDALRPLPGGRPLVLGLARGGVPVAAPVAEAADGDLDVLVVRKIGAPGHEELAIGAIASGAPEVRNDLVIRQLGLGERDIARQTERARDQLRERERRLRGARPFPPLAGRVVVLVDDGLATGATMRAAIAAVRASGPAAVVVAVPVGAPDTCAELGTLADALVCPLQPAGFHAVGQWYRNFDATTDADVARLLREH